MNHEATPVNKYKDIWTWIERHENKGEARRSCERTNSCDGFYIRKKEKNSQG